MAVNFKKLNYDAKEVAKERIRLLFDKADLMFTSDKALANRYVTLARKLAMKYKVRLPSELKRRYCKHCYRYLRSGENLRIRTREGKLVYYCLECKKFWKKPIGKK